MLTALACGLWPRGPAAAPAVGKITAALVNIPPWTSLDAPAVGKGIMVELFDELSQLSGIPIDIIKVPYAREVMMIEKGTAVLTIALRTAVIDRIATPLTKLGTEEVVVASMAGSGIASISDLRGKLVAQLRYSDYLSEVIADPLIHKYDTTSYQQSVRMLLEKRVDAVIGLHTSLLYAIRQQPQALGRLGAIVPLRTSEFGIFSSRTFHDVETIGRLEAAAHSITQRRVFDRLRGEYQARGRSS
jgi:ABC-type amino acid transport substrate-binding protein